MANGQGRPLNHVDPSCRDLGREYGVVVKRSFEAHDSNR